MTPTVLGVLGDALATLEEAQLYGFSTEAALNAALDHLELADRDEAVLIAGLLAAWIVVDLRPGGFGLGDFLEHATAHVKREAGCR